MKSIKHLLWIMVALPLLTHCIRQVPPIQSSPIPTIISLTATNIAPTSLPSTPTLHSTPATQVVIHPATSTGRIIFASNREGDYELYSMSPAGLEQTRLVADVNIVHAFALSPDGKRIALISGKDYFGEMIYLLNADGSELYQLLGREYAPYTSVIWSPNQNEVIFVGKYQDTGSILSINIDTSEVVQLSKGGSSPAFSPNGRKIAYTSSGYPLEDVSPQVFIMDSDGHNQQQLTFTTKAYYNPVWLPDGRHILSVVETIAKPEIYEIDVNGSEQRQLTYNLGVYGGLALSPNNQYVAFTSQGDSNAIYTIDLNNFELRRLTSRAGAYLDPEWSFDSTAIVFSALMYSGNSETSDFEIWTMQVSDSEMKNISNNGADDLLPMWQY